MERRRFLGAAGGATLAGIAGLSAMGCGATQPALGRAESQRLLTRLDHGLDRARRAPIAERFPTAGHERVLRLGLEALVLTDVARDIPAHAPLPAQLGDRLRAELGVLDRATETYGGMLAGMSVAGRRELDLKLRRQPDAPMSVSEMLTERARANGLEHGSAARLRGVAHDVTRRARRQSFGAVMDDTVGKVERVLAQKGRPVALARQASANAMLAGIWQAVEDASTPQPTATPAQGADPAQLGDPAQPEPTAQPSPGPITAQPYIQESGPTEPEPESGRGDPEIAVGAVMAGAGPVVFGIATLIGAAAGDVGLGALIGATPGGTLVIVGLIVLFIGVGQNA